MDSIHVAHDRVQRHVLLFVYDVLNDAVSSTNGGQEECV
jgi:hypothetical protein